MTAIRLATWNVNSVRIRLDHIRALVAAENPDVLCLQEIKVETHLFPGHELAAMGFEYQAVAGMKGYNGVAILSKRPFRAQGCIDWCGRQDARHIWVAIDGFGDVHNIYIPAGGDEPDPDRNPKFAHKLAFLDELAAWSATLDNTATARVLTGDFNVAPLPTDVWSHKKLRRVVTHTEVEIERLAAIASAGGWTDAIRHFVPATEKIFTWWSYRARDWRQANRGRRLDHVWVSAPLRDRLAGQRICTDPRGWERPSDHVPVIVDFTD